MIRPKWNLRNALTIMFGLAVLAACTGEPITPTPSPNTLTVTVDGDGVGTVTSQPAGISVSTGSSSADFSPSTDVLLQARAEPGSSFVGWDDSGACSSFGTADCTVSMSSDRSVTATFELGDPDVVTVSVTVVGDGSVTSDPAGIDVGADDEGSFDFAFDTAVTLTPTDNPGSMFVSWSGACDGSGACSLDGTSNASVTANFVPVSTLTLSFAGSGSGSVTSTPAGIDASAATSATFPTGTEITLAQQASAGSLFTGWGGACTGETECVLTLDDDATVTATFELGGVFAVVAESDTAEEYAEDIWENYPAGSVDTTSSDLDLTFDTGGKPGTTEQRGLVVVGIRFAGVEIPEGATITSAFITFTPVGFQRGDVVLDIEGQNVDDAPTFVHVAGVANNDITNRARTTASVAWAADSWGATSVQSTDLTSIVQEIVSRPGWSSGNAMAFIIDSDDSDATNYRRAVANGTSAPRLTLTYALPD